MPIQNIFRINIGGPGEGLFWVIFGRRFLSTATYFCSLISVVKHTTATQGITRGCCMMRSVSVKVIKVTSIVVKITSEAPEGFSL